MKKYLALFLAAALAFSLLSGCGSKDGNVKDSNPGTSASAPVDVDSAATVSWEDSVVRVGIDLDPGTLGPYESNNTGRKQTLYEVYETLAMYQGRGGEIKGVLAKDWYEESDKVYIVELYDYIIDTNGNKITADDVIFSFDEGMQTYKRYLKYIESIEKVDEYTVRITVNSDDIGTIEHILCQCWVVDQDSYTGSPDKMATEPIGTGPYKVVEHVEGSKVIMQAKEDYWQTDKSLRVDYQHQNVRTIEFIVIPEATQQAIALETGTVDIVNGMSYAEASRFMNNENYNVSTVTDHNTRVLYMNCNEASIMSDIRVRQAFLCAFDSQGLVDGALDGQGDVAYAYGNGAYPDIDPAWDDGDYYEYNPEKAKELLKEAGYENGCTVRLLIDTKEQHGKVATIMQSYLAQVGITLEILQYEETLVKTYNHDFTMFDVYFAYGGAPDYIVIGWHSQLSDSIYEDGLNYCGINDPTCQSLLETALNKNTHNEQSMTALYNYMTDNAYVYGIYNPYTFAAANKTIVTAKGTHDNWLMPGCCTYVWN